MQHTSEAQATIAEPKPERKEEGRAVQFFSHEQLYAFSLPPSDRAISKIKKQGSDQDYLPGEYIRLLLNRYIGPGMYDLEVDLSGPLITEIIKKDKWERGVKSGTVENVAVTANVSVTIVIYAADGSGRTRRYSAVGSHTMYGLAEAGSGAIISNAIKSAETAGLKRAVQPLGRAFGLDLKNKVKDDDLPPGIGHFRRLLEERKSRRENANDRPQIEMRPSQSSNETLEGGDRAERSASPRREAQPPAGNDDRRAADQDRQDPQRQRQATPDAERPRDERQTGSSQRSERPEQQRRTENGPAETSDSGPSAVPMGRGESRAEADGRSKGADATTNGSPADTRKAAGTGQAEQGAQQGGSDQPSEPEWDLSMTPRDYASWVSCIKTMTSRVSMMVSEKELANFARRNSKLIGALPVIEATETERGKDFPGRWKRVMERQYQNLNLPVPEQYATQPA